MKHRLLLAVTALALALGACQQAPTQTGQALAQEFIAAWGDTTALKQVAAHYHAASDSLWVPNTDMYLKRAFLEGTALNDSMRAVAQLIAYDIDDYAHLQAYRILGDRPDKHFQPDTARLLLQLIDWSAQMMHKPDYAAAAKQAVDRQVQDLSVDRQMAIYTLVATPTTLGMELKAEREAPDADHQLIDKQVKELERIYDAQQLQEFHSAYGSE